MKRSLLAGIPSIDSLIVFERAAQYLSFTKAGQHLGLTQSAVSRQIIDLEELLQVRLFDREKQRLRLSDAGAEYRELVRPIVQDLQAASMRMQLKKAQSTVLNISVAVTFCNLWFIPNLPSYKREQDAVQINVMPHIGPINFEASTIDAAIVNADRPPDNCDFVKLIDLDLAPFASRELLQSLGATDSPHLQDFARMPVVDIREVPGTWPRYFSEAGLSNLVADCVGSHSLILLNYEAAVAGLGFALLPVEFVESEAKGGNLVRLHDNLLSTGRSYYFCWPKRYAKKEAVMSLKQWLQREVPEARRRGSRTTQN